MTKFLRAASLTLLLGGALPPPAAAEETSFRGSVQTAKVLMQTGRSVEARSLLQELAADHPRSNDVAFLLGLLALQSREYDAAVDHFRSILVRNPDAVRVRLELGRAFFLKHDYENAYRQFQFARAGRLPRGVEGSIDRFVAAIRRDKEWSYNLSFAVAPDSNVNNGTSARATELFGLPFELSDDTRRKSGVGVAIDAGAEFAPQIGERVRLRLGAGIQRREYGHDDFDEMTVALFAGPRLLLPAWDLSLLATGVRRQLGGHRLYDAVGARVEATHHRGARTAITLGASAQQIRYADQPLQDGAAFAVSARAVRALTPASSLNARVGASRRTAQTPELASRSAWAGVGYFRELAGGFSVYLEPSYGLSRHDAVDPFFGKRRKDRLLELQLAVLHRQIVFTRFTPRIALTFARRDSSVELYDFKQRRLEVGVTSSF